jgi:hypothetical protein
MDIVAGLRASINNPMASDPEFVIVMPGLLQLAIDEIERLRAILRTCQHGMEVIDIGGGELRGLYLPNKEKPHD